MADLEELERRKRELELQRDIDRLERNERLRRQAEKIGSAASGASAAGAGYPRAHFSVLSSSSVVSMMAPYLSSASAQCSYCRSLPSCRAVNESANIPPLDL
jgi:hypothetical protein